MTKARVLPSRAVAKRERYLGGGTRQCDSSVVAVQVPGILRIEKRLLFPDLPLLGREAVVGDLNTIIKSG